MALRLTDTIMGTRPAFDPGVILSRMDQPDAKDKAFLDSLVKWCKVAGIDPAVPAAQYLLETDNGKGARWNNDLNASGMGIVADSTAQPFYISNVDAAARLFVQCLYSLVNRNRHPGISLWVSTQSTRGGEEWFSDVWLPKVQSRAMPDVTEVADLGLRYTENGDSRATWSWEDGKRPQDSYGKKLVSRLTEFYPDLPDQDPPVDTPSTPEEPVEQEPPMVDTSKLVTGRVPHPLFIDAEVSKPSVQSGYGYDTVSPRKNVGCCWHEWDGSGNESIAFVSKFFGPNGERYTNALVDYAIMRDSAGTIVRLNNPRGTRSPWASGGGVESGGLEGDGPAFYNKFGIGAINAKLVSTEIVKSDSQNYTDAQIESAARLAAYWHDQDGQYYFEHPYTTKYGIVTSFLHFEFGTTSCGLGELDDITKVQARTRAIMEQYQTGATQPLPDNPPDVPPLPELELPGGISLDKAKERFGTLRKIDAKVGTSTLIGTYGFDAKGVISLGWAQKCAEVFGADYDKWPAAGDWIVFQEPIDKNTNDLITFDGWDQNMLRKNEQQGFIWV